MRSNHEHHTVACFRHNRPGIDHHSYEVGDWPLIKERCNRMGARRIPLCGDPDGTGSVLAEREYTVNRWGRGLTRI